VTIKVLQKKTHTSFQAASRSYLSKHISEEISRFTTKQHERETGPLSPRKFRLRLKLTFSETSAILDTLTQHFLLRKVIPRRQTSCNLPVPIYLNLQDFLRIFFQLQNSCGMSLIHWKTARAEVSSVAVERPTVFGGFPLSNLAEAFTLSGSVEERVLCGIRAVLHIANVESNPIAYLLYQRVDTGLMIINLDGCELVAINSSPDTILDCQITEIPYQLLFVRTMDALQNAVSRAAVMIAS